MKIGFVSHHCCIRVIKQGIALSMAGHDVRFIQNRIANQKLLNILPWVSFYTNELELAAKATNWDLDIIHVHNEPDWMTVVIKDVRPDLKIVHDCHDLETVRTGKPDKDEAKALNIADGLAFSSIGFLRHFDNFYGKDDRPKEVIYSMCLANFLCLRKLPRCNGIVYQGGSSVGAPEGFANYRDYREITKTLCTMGIPFYIYPAGVEDVSPYRNVGAVVFPPLEYNSLMQQLNRYDWGLVASPIGPQNAFNWAMPNKLFEYIMAGIPVIVLDLNEAGEFVKEHELGVVIESIDDVPKIYDQHEHYRQKVKEKRHLFTMESQVAKIENLYQRVLGGENK